MDENCWRLAQIVMWFIGAQTGILGGLFVFLWNNLNKKIDKQGTDLNAKIDKQGADFNAKLSSILHALNDIDKRLYGVENVLHMKDCCVLKQDQNLKKVE